MTEAPEEREDEGAWAKLRHRKVGQWGVAYVAGAWGFLQGLAYVSTLLDWPAQLQRFAGLVLLIGLPIVLVLAWYHGDKGQQRVSRTELAILTLLFALGGALFWRYEHANHPSPGASIVTTAPAPVAAATDAGASIAVLPFENRSDEHKDAFFVDGIHDDILTQLSKIRALKVISRTSVERFRESKLSMREIAQQLGAKTILEGAVQRAGDRVRVNVQLIDAATDTHLWAENYDRELTAANIFAIQSEVAAAIAAALKATLTAGEKASVNALPTQNLQAWEAYQLGRQRMAKRTSKDLADAREFFQRAIDLDPKFALAYAGLADSIWLYADFSGQPLEPAMANAEQLLGVALNLDPNLAEALTTLAKFAQERREFERAESGYRRAIEINPNYATAYHWYSQLLALQGRDAEALQSLHRAIELDPLSIVLQSNLAWALSNQGQFENALAGFERAREIDALNPLPYAGIGTVYWTAYGRLNSAIPFFRKAIELDASGSRYVTQLAQIYLDLGDDMEASRLLERATGDRSANAVREYLNLYRGDPAKALAWGRRAVDLDMRDWRALAPVRNADLLAHDATTARARYARSFRELLGQQSPAVDPSNFYAAIDLAFVLQSTGERDRAAQLLDRSEALIRTTTRLGLWGYGVADVQIHSLRGDKANALAALRAAEKAGWRGPYWRYYRDFDPNLASIRNEPEFKAVFTDIEREMARQRTELAKRPNDTVLDLQAVH